MDLSVVVPVFNQKDKIQFASDTLDCGLKNISLEYEILFFDNASRDGSQVLLEEICSRRKNIKFFRSKKKIGFGASLRALFEQARGEAIVYMDVSLPIALQSFPALIEKMRDTDILVGSRYRHQKNSAAPKKSFLFYFYCLICRFFFQIPIEDIHPQFLFFYKNILPALDLKSRDRNIFPEMFVKAKKEKFVIQEFFIDPQYSSRQFSAEQKCSFFTFVGLFQIKK